MSQSTMLLAGHKILVVEDDYLVALAFSELLEAAGAEVLGPFSMLTEALSFIEEGSRIDAAIPDVDLHGERSYPMAQDLRPLFELQRPLIHTVESCWRFNPPKWVAAIACALASIHIISGLLSFVPSEKRASL